MYLPTYLPACLPIYLSIESSFDPFIQPANQPTIYVCLSLYISTYLSLYLYLCVYTSNDIVCICMLNFVHMVLSAGHTCFFTAMQIHVIFFTQYMVTHVFCVCSL